MAINFSIRKKRLHVTVTASLVYPNDHSYVWDFGDGLGSTEPSSQLTAEHEYAEPGSYTITLSVFNPTGDNVGSISNEVIVTEVLTQLPLSISDSLDVYLPNWKIPDGLKQPLIEKWQLYLQPLVNHEVPVEQYNNELYYEALENQLVIELTMYDYLVLEMSNTMGLINDNVKDMFTSESSGSSTTEDDDQEGDLAVKRIVTGPTEVEYFDRTNMLSDYTDALIDAFKPDGILQVIKQKICMLAERLDVYLPICANQRQVIAPKVVNRRRRAPIAGPDPRSITR